MQIVIDISEDDYRKVQDGRASVSMMRRTIVNGTPLTKGHGRLIDADRIVRTAEKGGFGNNRDIDFVLSYIPKCRTIIEADKPESEVEE